MGNCLGCKSCCERWDEFLKTIELKAICKVCTECNIGTDTFNKRKLDFDILNNVINYKKN